MRLCEAQWCRCYSCHGVRDTDLDTTNDVYSLRVEFFLIFNQLPDGILDFLFRWTTHFAPEGRFFYGHITSSEKPLKERERKIRNRRNPIS